MTRLRAFLAALQRAARTAGGSACRCDVHQKGLPPLLVAVFGRWEWQAPKWVTWTAARRRAGGDTSRRIRCVPPFSALCSSPSARDLLVCDPSQAALRHLRRHRARPDRIQRHRHLLDQAAAIVFSESAAPLKHCRKRDDRHRSLAGDCRHVVLDERQGAAVHAEGRLAGRRRVHGAVRQKGLLAARGPARRLPSSSEASRSPRRSARASSTRIRAIRI